jgi:putative membrane protein
VLPPPTEPSLAQRGKLKALGTLDGNHFDKNFADSVGVSAHKDTVSLFEKEATKGTDPDLKAYAAKTLPTLKDHLKMAQDLQASVKQ